MGITATCAADTEAVRIPPHDQLAQVCRTALHRRCELFRGFLGFSVTAPGRWTTLPDGARKRAAPAAKR